MHPGGQEWLKVLERTSLQAREESGCVPQGNSVLPFKMDGREKETGRGRGRGKEEGKEGRREGGDKREEG